ncbi:MAG: hypothetical protein AAFU70_04340, partial [Planctomycetota bacterium]
MISPKPLIVLAGCGLAHAAAALADAQALYREVVRSTDAVPAGVPGFDPASDTFPFAGQLSLHVIDDDGRVTFATITQPSFQGTILSVWTADPDGTRRLQLAAGQAHPALPTVTINRLAAPFATLDGSLGVTALVGPDNDRAVFLAPASERVHPFVIQDGNPAGPPGTENIVDFDDLALGPGGRVVVAGDLQTGPGSGQGGFFTGTIGTGLSLRSGPFFEIDFEGEDLRLSETDSVEIDAGGNLLVNGRSSAGFGGPDRGETVASLPAFEFTGTLLALDGELAPGPTFIPPLRHDRPGNIRLADNGIAAFRSDDAIFVASAPEFPNLPEVGFVTGNQGDVPGIGILQGEPIVWQSIGAPALSTSGNLAFTGSFEARSRPSDVFGTGVWRMRPDGEPELLAKTGDPVPGSPGLTLFIISAPKINDKNQVVFTASFADRGAPVLSSGGLFAATADGTIKPIAVIGTPVDLDPRPGTADLRDVAQIAFLATDFSATRELTTFNNNGEVSFALLEDANTSSLVVAQIEPECSPADLVFPFGVLGQTRGPRVVREEPRHELRDVELAE